jgi:hypothetical protein
MKYWEIVPWSIIFIVKSIQLDTSQKKKTLFKTKLFYKLLTKSYLTIVCHVNQKSLVN